MINAFPTTTSPTATGIKDPLDVVLCPVGSIGDVNPQLAIGAELRRRGHRITVMSNERFENACRGVAHEFVSIYPASALDALAAESKAFTYREGHIFHTRVHLLKPMAPLYRALAERANSERTVVVANSLAIGARIAQEVLDLPLLTVQADPHSLRGKGVLKMPRPMIVGRWVPRAFMNLQWWIADRFFIDPTCCDEINAFRRECGLKPISRVMDRWWNSPDGVLATFPKWWGSKQPEWPRATTVVGFPVYDRSEHESLPAALREFLAAGSPPVVYAPGNSHMHAPQHLAAIVAACGRVGRRVILINPRIDHGFDAKHNDVYAADYVPFRQLLSHVAVVAHHAGAGSAAAAMRAGVPQLLTPTSFNQPDTAARLERLGVGRTVMPHRFTVDRLTRALQQLLDDPRTQTRCREVATWFGPENEAAELAADRVEQFVAERHSGAARLVGRR